VKNPFASVGGWLKNLFRRGDDPRREVRYVLPYSVSGLNLSPDEMLSLAAVWACIDAIASSIAAVPWNVYQPLGPHRRQLLYDDALMDVLNVRPNPEMTAIGFREAMLFQGIPFGNSYAEIVKDRAGRVAQLWPLISDRMLVERDEKWNLVYRYRQITGEYVTMQPSQVFHLRGPGMYGLMGENVIARAAKSISVAAAQERYAASFFGQGASPGGVLEVPGKLTPDVHKRLKDDWAEKQKGPENAHKPLFLEAGMKFSKTSVDPASAQLIEERQFSVEEIARWFKVPPHKIGHLLRATFSNIEHQSIEFVRDALTPWCRRLEQEADYKLFRRDRAPWRCTGIDTRALSAGDAQARANYYASGRQNGWLNANEIRAEEGYDEIGADGDVYLVNGTLKPITDVLNPPEPPAPTLPPGAGTGDDEEPTDDADAETDGSEAATVARAALTAILAGALQRFARRLSNRRADLAKRSKVVDIDAHLVEERARQLERLLEETAPAATFAQLALGRELAPDDVRRAAELVAAGEAPQAAVTKALPASCPQTT
jgi:HK97 family phage portal protein